MILGIFIISAGVAFGGFAQDTTDPALDSLLRAHRYPIDLREGQISGPGADFLRRETARSQFVMIGEFHNGMDIPRFTATLFRDLQQLYGFNYFAIEDDPEIVRQLMVPSRRGNLDSTVAMAKRYKHALQFWNDQEAEMIAAVARQSTARTQPIWGLDQVFGAQHILTRLRELAATDAARTVTDEFLARATPLESVRPTSPGTSIQRFVNRVDSVELAQLRTRYHPRAGSEADSLLASLERSNLIYRRGGYFGNNLREQSMKSEFMKQYRTAQRTGPAPVKVLARLGHLHMYRGINMLNVETFGNFLSEFARANDAEAFGITVYLINEPGTYWTLTESPEWKPLADVGSTTQSYIVDLRPLRARLNRFASIKPELRSVIQGFDVALLIASGKRSTMLRVN
ncbi:MAG: hypothetical protein ACRENP_19885 [Longimicrobiales bacterium]